MRGKKFFSLFLLLLILSTQLLTAQTTIGSDLDPLSGSLLDLKESETDLSTYANSTKGLLMPRVSLIALDVLEPCASSTEDNKIDHVGLWVYNLKEDAINGLYKAPYVWDGEKWHVLQKGLEYLRIDPQKCLVPFEGYAFDAFVARLSSNLPFNVFWVEGLPSWVSSVTISSQGGLYIKVLPNNDVTSRTHTLTITNGRLSANLIIEQEKQSYFLNLNPQSVNIDSKGTSSQYIEVADVETNIPLGSLQVLHNADWISGARINSRGRFELRVLENGSSQIRSTIVNVTDGGANTASMLVSQSSANYYLNISNLINLPVPFEGYRYSTQVGTVNTNIPVSDLLVNRSYPSWIRSVDVTANKQLVITVAPNLEIGPRYAQITVENRLNDLKATVSIMQDASLDPIIPIDPPILIGGEGHSGGAEWHLAVSNCVSSGDHVPTAAEYEKMLAYIKSNGLKASDFRVSNSTFWTSTEVNSTHAYAYEVKVDNQSLRIISYTRKILSKSERIQAICIRTLNL